MDSYILFAVLAIFQPLQDAVRALDMARILRIGELAGQDSRNWHDRGWLVLLRASHQRMVAARASSRWRWADCSSKHGNSSDDIFTEVVPLPRKKYDIEGGRGSLAHGRAALEFRQLLKRVVEYEEDGIFRSIVGYL